MAARHPRPPRLTSAQAEVLELLWGQDWRGTPFTPEQVFPARDNVDNAHRRTLRTLARAGLLEIVDPAHYRLTLRADQCDAYQDWLARHQGREDLNG